MGPKGKPIVRFGELRNLTSGHADMDELRDRLAAALTAQDVLSLRSGDDAPVEAAGDEGVLVITGSIESEETSSDGSTRKTIWVVLRLIEPSQQGIVAMSRTKTQTISER